MCLIEEITNFNPKQQQKIKYIFYHQNIRKEFLLMGVISVYLCNMYVYTQITLRSTILRVSEKFEEGQKSTKNK